MFNQFLEKARSLTQNKEPFAIAFVVNRQLPSSGKPGDKAVIEKDGTLTGWIGGGCTRGIVLKEASAALQDGKPRVVRISPEGPGEPRPGVVDYNMTCHSGGTVELYIEPVLPRPHLLILGKSHVAMALARIGRAMDYPVTVVARGVDKHAFPDAERVDDTAAVDPAVLTPNTFIVVCTQGENDEDALQQALESELPYVSFVASRAKANAVFRVLRQRGLTFDQLKRVKTPAGLDINAKLPEEVAISILAEVIAFMRREEAPEAAGTKRPEAAENDKIFINPVCNVPVEKATARHVVEYEGMNYYFCCDGCKVSFEKEPEKYALKPEEA
ncbi:MAG: XdhC family protein [Phaeodactylibacter sp.]|nr:XdhC family protein [Phaeodactylibacter sp.]MCB9296034.1 XdhC family protein [Lewinellaceae bacterium]